MNHVYYLFCAKSVAAPTPCSKVNVRFAPPSSDAREEEEEEGRTLSRLSGEEVLFARREEKEEEEGVSPKELDFRAEIDKRGGKLFFSLPHHIYSEDDEVPGFFFL